MADSNTVSFIGSRDDATEVEVYFRQGTEWRSGKTILMPRVIPDQTAGSIWSACDSVAKIWSMAGITDLCKNIDFVLICEMPDGCSANLRKIHAMASRLPPNGFLVMGLTARIMCLARLGTLTAPPPCVSRSARVSPAL